VAHESEERLRQIFAEAERNAPMIIFKESKRVDKEKVGPDISCPTSLGRAE